MPTIRIRTIGSDDRAWIPGYIAERWGAPTVIAHGVVYRPQELQGFVAHSDDERIGLITYHVAEGECEIVSLNSDRRGSGIGTALLEAVKDAAWEKCCRRLWLITTNDNLDALRFYQRRGFTLVAVHRNAMEASRRLKPEIPLIGEYGIPLHDEIELEMIL